MVIHHTWQPLFIISCYVLVLFLHRNVEANTLKMKIRFELSILKTDGLAKITGTEVLRDPCTTTQP
jgi:hypothetical protein